MVGLKLRHRQERSRKSGWLDGTVYIITSEKRDIRESIRAVGQARNSSATCLGQSDRPCQRCEHGYDATTRPFSSSKMLFMSIDRKSETLTETRLMDIDHRIYMVVKAFFTASRS